MVSGTVLVLEDALQEQLLAGGHGADPTVPPVDAAADAHVLHK